MLNKRSQTSHDFFNYSFQSIRFTRPSSLQWPLGECQLSLPRQRVLRPKRQELPPLEPQLLEPQLEQLVPQPRQLEHRQRKLELLQRQQELQSRLLVPQRLALVPEQLPPSSPQPKLGRLLEQQLVATQHSRPL